MEKGRSPRTAAKLGWDMLRYRTSRSATGRVSAPLLHHLTQGHTKASCGLSCCGDRRQISAFQLWGALLLPASRTYQGIYSTSLPPVRCAGMEQPYTALQTGRQLTWEQLWRKGHRILVNTKWTWVSSAPFPTPLRAAARLKPAG